MQTRDNLKKRAIKYGGEFHWELHKQARDRVNVGMRKAKSEYHRRKIDTCSQTDPKKTWRLINSLFGKQNKGSPVNELRINGN